MFTGLIEELGSVAAVTDQGDAVRLSITSPTVLQGTGTGDSIAVNGCCLTVVEHDGRKLHLQCEDLGSGTAAYEVRVYEEGTVLWLKRFDYGDLVAKDLSRQDHEHDLRLQIEKTLQVVQAAIHKGKIG